MTKCDDQLSTWISKAMKVKRQNHEGGLQCKPDPASFQSFVFVHFCVGCVLRESLYANGGVLPVWRGGVLVADY